MKEYLKSIEEVLKDQDSGVNGLTAAEASSRLEKFGPNKLKEAKKDSLVKRFFLQMKDPMVLILILAAVLSGVTAAYSHEGFADVFIILAVVVLNAILGVYQESKAEKALEALQEMAKAKSRVLRDGKIEIVDSEKLVPGDILLLEAGDSVPADGRLIENASLKIEEAALTGESVPVNKHVDTLTEGRDEVPLGDRKNMVYMGSTVVYGRGKVVLTGTGMNTEMGKIAEALTLSEEGETPLQKKLNELGKMMTLLVLLICLVVFAVNVLRMIPNVHFEGLLATFMIAVSLAVAAVPEGLVAVVTIVLSIGVTNMSKRNAVIRKLTAVETLGCTQIICSDKTGTLTQNRMTVVEEKTEDKELLAKVLSLASDAYLNDEKKAEGEPTEAALVAYAYTLGLDKGEEEKKHPRIGEIPFESMRKMMTTFHQGENGEVLQFTKGAPDVVIDRSAYYYDGKEAVPMTAEKKEEFLRANKEMADKALRVLSAAFVVRPALPEAMDSELCEKELCLVGLVGMIDPIRPEVKLAIQECAEAGIRPIMITGDHKDTAVAIAKQLGILREGDRAITGTELGRMTDEELDQNIEHISVYARVQPEHKVRIVKGWKKKDKIVAMTGDGVNDAPSIKAADIGVGMGITGTDVTKNVADMVLADDNFATIVHAVEEGRKIYENIRKTIQFLLSSNLAEVIAIFIASLFGFTILLPVHLLWINLITDSLPAVALGMEKGDKDLMKKAPRSPKEGVFAQGLGADVLWQGAVVALLTLLAYFIGHYMEAGVFEIVNSEDGMTMAFLTLSMAEMFHSLNMRSRRHSIFSLEGHNKYLFLAMLLSLLASTLVIYVPFLNEAFKFESISIAEYFVALGLAFLMIPIVEVVKFFQRKAAKG